MRASITECISYVQMHCFKDLPIDKTRSAVGRFGITGKAQTQPIKNLSDGLRSRVVFAKLAYESPNMVSLFWVFGDCFAWHFKLQGLLHNRQVL